MIVSTAITLTQNQSDPSRIIGSSPLCVLGFIPASIGSPVGQDPLAGKNQKKKNGSINTPTGGPSQALEGLEDRRSPPLHEPKGQPNWYAN